jgi:hypothetical protein
MLTDSLTYLQSDEAFLTLEKDPYWPKWTAPWWHMLLLHELGLTREIPEKMVKAFIDRVNRVPLHIFPIQPEERAVDEAHARQSFCHCQVGNIYQVLFAYGIDVDRELPWMRPWFLRYQMADGGMNCDNDAYLIKGEIPSSMVGMIAPFEAVLKCTPRAFTAEEKRFLDLGAQFLIERELRLGSDTDHNAEERETAPLWMKTCFPRFYLYDVLRGLDALTLWAEKTGGKIPSDAILDVVAHLEEEFPDGQVKNQRHSYEGVGTRYFDAEGRRQRLKEAYFFPWLEQLSRIGDVSPVLTKNYATVRARLLMIG